MKKQESANLITAESKGKERQTLGSRLLSGIFSAIGSLPFGILYGVSDLVALLAGGIIGYRRKVIRENLRSSFPEKNEKELRAIEKGFYRFLGDYFVETIRLGRMNEKEVSRRMRFEGVDEVRKALEEGRNVSLYLGHYCNWEWLSSIPLHLKDIKAETGQIYHPLENQASDEAFLKIRGRFGATSIKMSETLPTIMRWRKEGKPSIIGYIADQVPMLNGVHYFADFLNHDTPVFTGPERLSRMLHAEVYYCDIFREKRGYYVCKYVKMTEDASGLPQFELTRKYYSLLEESIRREPRYWLWSHRRWKRTREDFFNYYGKEQAEKRLQHL